MTSPKKPYFILTCPRLSFLEVLKIALWTAFALIYQKLFCFPLGYQMAWNNFLMKGQFAGALFIIVVIATPSLLSIGIIYSIIRRSKKV